MPQDANTPSLTIDAGTPIKLDAALLRASAPVMKRCLGRTPEGQVVEYDEVQLRLENISGVPLVDLTVDFSFFDVQGTFLGKDEDLHPGTLVQGATWVPTTVLDFPAGASRVSIEVMATAYTAAERFSRWGRLPLTVLALGVVLALAYFQRAG